MQIDIITRHAVPNYGSLLQSYATQKTIKKLGHTSKIIDYVRYDERSDKIADSLLKEKKWNKNIITRLIFKIIQKPNFYIMYKKFDEFRKDFLVLTDEQYGNLEELKNNSPKADIYCSGSDQIWGKIGSDEYDEAYFLDFVENKKCISYASSFGKTELNEDLKKNLGKLLEKYQKILVREESAKDILKNIGVDNVEQVLDPTLLLDKEEWIELSNKSNKKIDKKYALVYQLHNSKEFDEYAKNFAKEKNIELYRISPSIHHITRSGKLIYMPTQYDFLKYFDNAEYILTDSFHATAFSIIFNKKFIDILPPNKTGTRIESILNLFGIKNRILKDYNDFDSIEEEINYEEVNQKLAIERSESIDLFKQAIEN